MKILWLGEPSTCQETGLGINCTLVQLAMLFTLALNFPLSKVNARLRDQYLIL